MTDANNPSVTRSLDAGDTFNASIELRANDQFGSDVDELDETSTLSTVVERSATFDTTGELEINDNDAIVVDAAEGQTVSGTTTVAPGTELDITLANAEPSLFISARDTVTQNGTFNITADFSQYPDGQNFTATITGQGFEDDAETPGRVRGQVATVTFNNQSFSGQATSVNVASASLSDGGFVTIHDNTVGSDPLGSVRGTSEFLAPGTSENVTVELDEPIARSESGDTFFAMPHLDTDGDETYDFVTSEGADDGPCTDAEGNIVLVGATITVERAPSVTFNDQQTEGEVVEVQNAQLPDGGFVTIHDDTVADDPLGSVRGTSEYFDPGRTSSIEITLDDPIEEGGQFFAMPHRDTNGNEVYDFVSSEGAEDAPYFNANNEIVLDGAQISVPSEPTPTPTATPEPDDPTPTPTETSGQPGFGLVVSLIALIGAALIALRRRD